MKYIWTILIGLLLLLLFIELQVDFCIAFSDTAFVGLVTFVFILSFLIRIIFSAFRKKWQKVISSIVFLIAIIVGTGIGMSITSYQLKIAKTYVEDLARKIKRHKVEKGYLPGNLNELGLFKKSPKVPIGFLNKRPLYYRVNNENSEFKLWFSYTGFLIATYSSDIEKWQVDD